MPQLMTQVKPTAEDGSTVATPERLSSEDLRKIDAYWRARRR